VAHVYSDWAGCRKTSRSTSGGTVRLGAHTIMVWSSNQAVVALSSGEAELYALTKGAANILGMISLAADFGMTLHGRIFSDASAALGVVNRTGVGKLRHIRVQFLWIQDKVRDGELEVKKVPGVDNPADLLTKNVDAATMNRHLVALGYESLTTRASTAPSLNYMAKALQAIMGEESESYEDSKEEDYKKDLNGEDVKDKWEFEGMYVTRKHEGMRYELFTPRRVSGAPPSKALTPTRITEGVFLMSGRSFRRVDTWTARSTAHLPLSEPWTGRSIFIIREGERST